MVRAIMHGCNGKMGQVITGLIKADEGIELVAGIDTYTGLKNDYPVFERIDQCNVEADVIIDFSNAGRWMRCLITARTGRFRWCCVRPGFQKTSLGR